jgi:hypothetical protein
MPPRLMDVADILRDQATAQPNSAEGGLRAPDHSPTRVSRRDVNEHDERGGPP